MTWTRVRKLKCTSRMYKKHVKQIIIIIIMKMGDDDDSDSELHTVPGRPKYKNYYYYYYS